jgi:hypothetical protein
MAFSCRSTCRRRTSRIRPYRSWCRR